MPSQPRHLENEQLNSVVQRIVPTLDDEHVGFVSERVRFAQTVIEVVNDHVQQLQPPATSSKEQQAMAQLHAQAQQRKEWGNDVLTGLVDDVRAALPTSTQKDRRDFLVELPSVLSREAAGEKQKDEEGFYMALSDQANASL